jgi:hypothetical protein
MNFAELSIEDVRNYLTIGAVIAVLLGRLIQALGLRRAPWFFFLAAAVGAGGSLAIQFSRRMDELFQVPAGNDFESMLRSVDLTILSYWILLAIVAVVLVTSVLRQMFAHK